MPKNSNILLIRHGEKPLNESANPGLTVAGQERAMAYVIYFQNFMLNSQLIKLDYLFATAQSAHSNRSYLTIQPLAQQLNLKINNTFSDSDEDVDALVRYIQSDQSFNGSNILICWHHEKLLRIAKGLGAGASHHTIPDDWPDGAFGWLIYLSYDASGILTGAATIDQKLMYNDHDHPVP